MLDEAKHATTSGNKDTGIGNQSASKDQQYVVFDIGKEKQKEKSDFESLYPNTTKERTQNNPGIPSEDYAGLSDEDLDNLENIPAYKRRNMRMNDPKLKKKISRFSISRDNSISDRNSYLHDQVD